MNEESGEHGQDDAGDEFEDEGVHPKGQPEKEVISFFVTFRNVMHVVLGLDGISLISVFVRPNVHSCVNFRLIVKKLFVLVGPYVECEILRN